MTLAELGAEHAVLTAGRRKRLGQFHTGERLALVLAALAKAADAATIVDPMGGSGDMLAACLTLGARPRTLSAVEIDPEVANVCRRRIGSAVVVGGSAFDARAWADLPDEWDLVITNPPYVRYQTAAAGSHDGDVDVPSAEQVRACLVDVVSRADHLGAAGRAAFSTCAANYSGLADLAVPSWLLCAARVAVGGRLAMVVPDTWLTRDYAAAVLYVLRRFFDVEYVVADADAAWFPDAVVRATLVVAQRVADRGTALGSGGHLRIDLPTSAANARSLVGGAFGECDRPELPFVDWARGRRQRGPRTTGTPGPVPATWSDEIDLVSVLRRTRVRHHWLAFDGTDDDAKRSAPQVLRRALGVDPVGLATLADLGWAVGQGLRTGANDFFYIADEPDGGVRSPLLPGEVLHLPDGVAHPALRRQSELPNDGRPVLASTRSRVLVLNGWALPEDIAASEGPRPWRPMDGDLARLVRAAAVQSYARGARTVSLPDLSAVRTNARRFDPRRITETARFWYHLPPLADRHVPALFLARVNAGHAAAYLNPGGELVIDANFSTLRPIRPTAVEPSTLLALLSSTWTRAYLEACATVMGGGALKVEATHLRGLLVPRPDDRAAHRLADLAEGWLAADKTDEARDLTRHKIDEVVFEALRPRPTDGVVRRTAALAAHLLRGRCPGDPTSGR